ncbi:Hint domain-containing protein [Methylobacterium sp. J-090]|uniref:Hint domain-containing protein n=1 Tax=Methylobacterium sp. J-090 TaxID=2836666 RepID=UPI001FB9BE9E|nr:Hint domain-containing protein [Methylobacterium sp. J-090]MCJ2084034.1 Hint domain-containing protein [Methylobacterium sp. J-090]
MALPLVFRNTVFQSGFAGTDDGAPSATFQVDDATTSPLTVNGTVNAVGDPITVTGTLPGSTGSSTSTFYATQYDNGSMIQFTNSQTGAGAGSTRLILSNSQVFGSGSANRTRFTADSNGTLGDYVAPVCFTTGTLIRTARGEVAVEDLCVGDVAVTASGAMRAVIWIGHRELRGAGQPLTHDQQPIRVRAGAFGPGLPARDLRLSSGHPVLVGADADSQGGALVPIMCLINGTTIIREPATSVTYWHVELDAHDILLAEGLAAESYLDGGDRPFFVEGSDHALHNPDFVVPGLSGRCRPVAVDGPLVEAERARLDTVFAAELSGHSAWDASNGLAALVA